MVSSNLNKSQPNFHRAEICQKFWGDLKTPKFHSEIKWPLELVFQWLYQIKDSKPIQSIWKKDVCWHSLGNPKTVLQFVCFQNEILWSKHLTEYCIDNSPRFWVQFPGAPKSSLQSITTSILQLFAPQTFFLLYCCVGGVGRCKKGWESGCKSI